MTWTVDSEPTGRWSAMQMIGKGVEAAPALRRGIGATFALALGMLRTHDFAAVIAFSPGIPSQAIPPAVNRRVLVSHGREDEVLSFATTCRLILPALRREGERVRVTAQLIRSRDGFHVWSQNFDRSTADVIGIQEQIAIAIARSLKTVMSPDKLAAMVSLGTRSVDAYEEYLRGLAYERAALTINFIRALIEGGFADLHHPEYWDLSWVKHSPHADEYRRRVAAIRDSLQFFESLAGSQAGEIRRVDYFTSHEGLHLLYEQAQTRLDTVSPGARRVLRAASVFGQMLPYPTVLKVWALKKKSFMKRLNSGVPSAPCKLPGPSE